MADHGGPAHPAGWEMGGLQGTGARLGAPTAATAATSCALDYAPPGLARRFSFDDQVWNIVSDG
jgi:hypothetical protein